MCGKVLRYQYPNHIVTQDLRVWYFSLWILVLCESRVWWEACGHCESHGQREA